MVACVCYAESSRHLERLCTGDANAPFLRQLVDRGYTFIWVDGDQWMLHGVCKQVADEFANVCG